MSPNARILLIIVAAVLGMALLIGGGIWYWWSQNASEFLDAGATAMNEGQVMGRGTDESGCMTAAVERHKADGSQRMGAAVRNNLWLTACLEASKAKDKFCEGVPAQDSLLAVGTWAATSCVQQGFSDPYCGNLFAVVAKYCSSPQRAEKLKADGKTRPAG